MMSGVEDSLQRTDQRIRFKIMHDVVPRQDAGEQGGAKR